MDDLNFYPAPAPQALAVVAAWCNASFTAQTPQVFTSIAALDLARPSEISVFGEGETLEALETTRAGACFVAAKHERYVPAATIALLTSDPVQSFRRAAGLFYPDSVGPSLAYARGGIHATAIIHPEARLEANVTLDPGVVIGPRVEIGAGTTIGAHSAIGAGVRIGRGCAIDSHVSISYAFIGDNVVIYAGARVGQGAPHHGAGMPHLGRVIIQNAAVIGANATIERGRRSDTVIGDGGRVETQAVVPFDAIIDRLAIVAR